MSMNRVFHPSAHAILYRLSDAAEHYKSEGSLFRVNFRKKQSRTFHTLLEAFLFYITIEEEADLYDISKGSVLIERKIELFLN
jgi:hypothetical protein